MLSTEQQKLDRLADWSVGLEISGTAVESAAEAREIHIADSLSGLEVPELESAETLIDIGSGAGFPGLVLAMALPDAQVTLVDSVRKKMEAAGKIAAELELANVDCVWGRAEEIASAGSDFRESADVVTARALAPLPALLEYAAPLLKVGGTLVAWKGLPSEDELSSAAAAAELLGFDEGRLVETRPFARSQHRHFFVARKTSETDARFPRRPGMARKKPLA